MFRRRSSTATDASEAGVRDGASGPSGKGRPTPSRKAAETARKERTKPQLDRKAATRAAREAARKDRLKARASLASGDERYLPARDKGPVRAFARDYVDARRTVGEYMLPLVFVFLLVNFIPSVAIRGYAILAFYLFMLLLLINTSLLGYRIRRSVEAKYPDEVTKGAGLYGAMRSMMLRRLRLPKPRVKVGGQPL